MVSLVIFYWVCQVLDFRNFVLPALLLMFACLVALETCFLFDVFFEVLFDVFFEVLFLKLVV